ncbi:MAG: hypothetical protein AAF289_00805 [Cyanobacteria bacterium P01_A01_bin.135]
MTTGLQQPRAEWNHAENMTCPYCKNNRIVHRGSHYKCITPGCNYTADAADLDPASQASSFVAAATAAIIFLLLL